MQGVLKNTIRINLWSGPRNISTAVMYSFAQRDDTCVIDEPLYAHYLLATDVEHPGRDEVLASMENDGYKVIDEIISGHTDCHVLFCKQMTHHLINLPREFILLTKNILLIRDPADVLLSYSRVIEQPTLSDIGIKQAAELLNFLEENQAHHMVVDADELLKDPEKMLKLVCENVGIEFQPAMLHWKGGGIPEDGVWAKYWYKNVHQSTGFMPFEKTRKELPERLTAVYNEAKPYYEFLLKKSLKVKRNGEG